MKIGIITDETDTQLVGLGTYTINLVRQILLQDKKNDYWLVHRRREEQDIYSLAKEIIIPSHRFPISAIRNFITMPLKLRKEKLDIVHHTSSIGPFVFRQMLPGKKNIQTIHDLIPLLHPELHELPVRIAFKYLLPKVARNVDHIITSSEKSKSDILRRFGMRPEKITVVYPAPSEKFGIMDKKIARLRVEKRFGIKEPYILCIGTLEKKKNIPTLLKAYNELRQKGIKHKLLLVGKKGFGSEEIISLINELGIGKDAIILGYAAFEDLPALYNAAAVFVFPSAYDGFGMPVAEALRCGCPAVVSDAGGVPEAVGDSGRVVGVYDVKGYSDALIEILENESIARELSRKGHKYSMRFSWKASAKKVLDAYESL